MAHRFVQYFADSFQELGRVTWPTKKRAISICILVVSFVVIAAAFIAGVDFLFHEGSNYLLTLAEKLKAASATGGGLTVTPQ